jgi:thiol-disulfide isomerase/thioredoxin
MFPALFLFASLVNDVRDLMARHDLAAADRQIRMYQQRSGSTPELAAAVSWIARGELEARNLDQADKYAAETRKLSDGLMGVRRLDAEPWLPMALGASIEVHAQVLAARGERPEAVEYLRTQLQSFANTSIGERIRKNLNLLNMEGKPAPALEETEWLGEKPPTLASLRGHPVMLFFWAHWCSDCKGEIPILADLLKKYGPRGLVLIGPTRRYGYAAGGEDATPAAEKLYIEKIHQQYYGALPGMSVPVSAANFLTYGSSTTPTIVLIDARGVVRFYHPGALPQAELALHIDDLFRK